MTREEKIKAIIEYFEENEDVFDDCIEALDGYNGYLGDERYYDMDELDELLELKSVGDVLRMAYYGHDAHTYSTNLHGEKEYGAFNPNREYFTFNGYGNLISCDYKDYSAFLDEFIIEEMAENRRYIDPIEDDDELAELFDALGEDDESEGESDD